MVFSEYPTSEKPAECNIKSFENEKDSLVSKKQRIVQQRKSLPIASVEKRLVEEVRKHETLIIVGETGSGKTTQLPQFLFNAGFCCHGGIIGTTQPRRVAAVSIANRVAEECGVEIGQKVGYSIRFDDMTTSSTRIKYMTDGLLLREALLDPYLSRYSVIIIDEAHERTIQTDILLALLKNVQRARSRTLGQQYNYGNMKGNSGIMRMSENNAQCFSLLNRCQNTKYSPLKLIVMSASLDAKGFSEYFGGARAVHVQGRQHPVDILYTYRPEPDYIDAVLITIFQIHMEEGPGDILVFLTGKEEIESIGEIIEKRFLKSLGGDLKLKVVPIFSSLPSEQQIEVFKPAPQGYRKVILATNIAETSITIPRIKYVIDPGLVKARSYNPHTGIESLNIVPISKAQALQRSGRAGREGPGKCYRLYPEIEFRKFLNSTIPEIKRCNLSSVVLQLKALGIENIIEFDFMEKPSRESIVKSLEQLFLLGALTDDGKLSNPVGNQMACLPLHPLYSKALIIASEFNCMEEMLTTVAMLSVESIFYAPRDKLDEATKARKKFSTMGDHVTLLKVYRACSELVEKSKINGYEGKRAGKRLIKWCRDNFINTRSLRHARDIHSQIRGQVENMGLHVASCGDDMLQFQRCLAASFFINAALKQPDGSYRTLASSQTVQIHPSSVLFQSKKPADCLIFNELVRTTNSYIRNVTTIDPLWLTELAPQYYAAQD